MKRSLIALVMLVLLALGVVSPANAETSEPNGEEEVVTLTVPTALNNCATTPEDISGVADIFAKYGDESVLVAHYTIAQDSDGFTITANLQSKYYSLNNPLNPGRSTSAVFQILRCEHVEIPTTEPVIVDPIVAPPVELPGTLPVPAADPIIPAPKAPEAVLPASSAVVVPTTVEPVTAVKEAPVAAKQEVAVVAASPVKELAATGIKEFWGFLGISFLIVGIALLVLKRKLAK
jgi:hypothetical protein